MVSKKEVKSADRIEVLESYYSWFKATDGTKKLNSEQETSYLSQQQISITTKNI
jgi:hypothetical protein